MHRKITATCLALVAFAAMAVVPALASASPVLTEGGTAVATGKLITATQDTNITLATSIGHVTCQKSTLTGTLTENSGTSIAGEITAASFTGTAANNHCSSTLPFNPTFTVDVGNLPYCLTSTASDAWSIRGGKCSEGAKNLTFTLTGIFTCKYERASVTGTYTTGTGTLSIGASQSFTGEAGNGGLCPGSGTLSGSWNLYTDTGVHDATTALTIG
jgi:hypothetical protein